jgi:P27 family predicted phage terminase small subunit
MTKPKVPKHFENPERLLWKKILSEYLIADSAGLKLLETALEAHSRARKARETVDKEGMTTTDRFGQVKAHPLITVERDARSQFLLAMKQLNLDIPIERGDQ